MRNEKIIVICYGKQRVYNSRKQAIKEFQENFIMSEGCERERYANILYDLTTGKTLCKDEY